MRGKFYARYQNMKLKVMIDPDVARRFPDSESVNAALRQIMNAPTVRPGAAASGTRKKAG